MLSVFVKLTLQPKQATVVGNEFVRSRLKRPNTAGHSPSAAGKPGMVSPIATSRSHKAGAKAKGGMGMPASDEPIAAGRIPSVLRDWNLVTAIKPKFFATAVNYAEKSESQQTLTLAQLEGSTAELMKDAASKWRQIWALMTPAEEKPSYRPPTARHIKPSEHTNLSQFTMDAMLPPQFRGTGLGADGPSTVRDLPSRLALPRLPARTPPTSRARRHSTYVRTDDITDIDVDIRQELGGTGAHLYVPGRRGSAEPAEPTRLVGLNKFGPLRPDIPLTHPDSSGQAVPAAPHTARPTPTPTEASQPSPLTSGQPTARDRRTEDHGRGGLGTEARLVPPGMGPPPTAPPPGPVKLTRRQMLARMRQSNIPR